MQRSNGFFFTLGAGVVIGLGLKFMFRTSLPKPAACAGLVLSKLGFDYADLLYMMLDPEQSFSDDESEEEAAAPVKRKRKKKGMSVSPRGKKPAKISAAQRAKRMTRQRIAQLAHLN